MSHERPQRHESRSKPSVFGDGLPERLRSTSFALLGITAAAGLGLIGLVLHQGWPIAPNLPIPGIPPKHEAVQERTVVAEAVGPEGAGGQPSAAEPDRSPAGVEPGPAPRAHSRLAAADRVAAQPPAVPDRDSDPAPPPAAEQPSDGSPPASQPAGSPPVETPSPSSQSNPAPIDSSPPVAASVDESEDDDQGDDDDRRDQGDDDVVRDRGQARPKSPRKQKTPPLPAESGEETPVQLPTVPQGDSDEDELDEDEDEIDDQQDYGRGRGHWRRGR